MDGGYWDGFWPSPEWYLRWSGAGRAGYKPAPTRLTVFLPSGYVLCFRQNGWEHLDAGCLLIDNYSGVK